MVSSKFVIHDDSSRWFEHMYEDTDTDRRLKSLDETIKLTVPKQTHHYRGRLRVRLLEDKDREKRVNPWLEVINRHYLCLFASLHHPSCSIFSPLHHPSKPNASCLHLSEQKPLWEDAPPSYHSFLSTPPYWSVGFTVHSSTVLSRSHTPSGSIQVEFNL